MKTLTDILYKYENKKLKYGTLDCCIFTAKVVEEYIGKKLPIWRDLIVYDNYADAIRILKQNGINSVEELPTAILGTNKKPITEAKTGEPVYLINDEGLPTLGICNGCRAYFIHSKVGLMALPLENCLYAWSLADG